MSIYLDQSLRRKAIDVYRAKHRKMRDARRRASTPIEMSSVSVDLPVEVTELEMEELLGEVYDSLNADERVIALLRRAGREWQDVAELLGRTEGSVRMQFHRAFTRLKTRLAQVSPKG